MLFLALGNNAVVGPLTVSTPHTELYQKSDSVTQPSPIGFLAQHLLQLTNPRKSQKDENGAVSVGQRTN